MNETACQLAEGVEYDIRGGAESYIREDIQAAHWISLPETRVISVGIAHANRRSGYVSRRFRGGLLESFDRRTKGSGEPAAQQWAVVLTLNKPLCPLSELLLIDRSKSL